MNNDEIKNGMVKRTPEELKEDLECFDLEIVYNDDNTLYVRTFEDRSVGIFGEILSPTFKNIDGLISWWDTINGLFLEL